MLTQTLEIDLAAGDVFDICPKAGGMIVCSAVFIDESGCYNAIPDGALCNACNDKGEQIYQLTAAAPMKGYLHISESFDSGPDCVKWPVATAEKEKAVAAPVPASAAKMASTK